MRYVVDIEAFHGPLDLLLYLVEKDQLDIYDISVSAITDQFMNYLNATGDFELERLGAFLVMASYLLNLKSRMLLPHLHIAEQEGKAEIEVDPREELIQRLLDYKKYKIAVQHLKKRQDGQYERIFYRAGGKGIAEKEERITGSVKTLFNLYLSITQDQDKPKAEFQLPMEDISIKEKMDELIQLLKGRKKGLVLQSLFADIKNIKEALALFLALLELIRLRKVKAEQEVLFGDITIFL